MGNMIWFGMKQQEDKSDKKHQNSHIREVLLIGLLCIVLYYISTIYSLHDKLDAVVYTYTYLNFDELFYFSMFIVFGLGMFIFRRFREMQAQTTSLFFSRIKLQKEVEERKKIEEYLRVQENFSRNIIQLIKKLEYANSYNEILDVTKQTLLDVMGYKTAWFYQFSEDRQTAELIFSEKNPLFIKQQEMLQVNILSDSYYSQIANASEISVIDDAITDESTSQKSFIKDLKIRTLVHIPLFLSNKSIGLLGTGTFRRQGIKKPNKVELEFLKNLSGHVALAINRLQLQEKRTEVEDALKNSEEKYRILIDQSADAIYLHEDGKYEIVNNKFIELFGITYEEVISQQFSLLKYTHPKSIAMMRERRDKVKAGIEVPNIYEFTALTKEKKEIEIEASISYIYNEGKIKTQGILRNISKRKRAESIQSTIFQISEAANLTDNLDDLISRIHLIVKSVMYAENLFVEIYDKNTDMYTSVYFVDQFDEIEEKTMSLKGSLTDYVRRIEKAVIINDTLHAELVKAGEAKYILKPSKVWMGAPLKTPFGVIGVIAVQSYENPNLYTSEDPELLNLISGQIAIAIEKKRVDEEKENNNKFFKLVIDSLSNPLYVINADDYTVAIANDAAKRIIFKNDSFDKHCYQLIGGNNQPCETKKHSCSLKNLLQAKKALKFEQTVVDKDNVESFYEVHSAPIYDDSGKIIQMIENFVDITERKRNENKLVELAVFPEANPNIVLSLNSKQEITYMNSATSIILGDIGISREKMSFCLPENLKDLIEIMLKENSGMQNIRVNVNDHILSWSFHPVVGQDIIHCYANDITQEVLQTEEINKLSTVATQSSNIVMITNLDGVIEYVNPYFTFVTGYESEEVVGDKASIIRSGATSKELYSDLWNSITKGITWTGKIENRKKNGDLYWESKTISPITNENDETISYISVGSDITNELKTQQQLIESEKHSAIATLAAGVAHEFKNYLGGIIGNASFSLDEIDSDDGLELAKETFVKIIEMGEKANDVAMSLLTFSKAKSDDRKKEDLKKIIEQSIKLVEKELDTLSIEIATYFEDIPTVEISLSKIQQLLLNLFINAKHAIGQNGVITIALLQKDGFVEIRVGDSGGGIEKEHCDKIFDPFFSTKGVWGEDEVTGTGMGLSICRNIAREHNGDLTVDTVLGVGSAFTITLPITQNIDIKHQVVKHTDENYVIFFTLNHAIVKYYYEDVCNSHLQFLLIDNFDKMAESIIKKTAYVICDARFSAKLELYRMVEFCLKHNQPYVLVNCGTMEYQLTDLYENSVANYKEIPDFYKLMTDFESSVIESKSN